MSLFDKIFKRPRATPGAGFFQTFTAYRPTFRDWNGSMYEAELVRAAVDARARHISKLKVEIMGAAKPALQAKLRHGPNAFQTWGQFLYRLSTILDAQNTAFVVPVYGDFGETTGFYPVLPSKCEVVDVHGEPWLRYQFSTGTVAAVELSNCVVMTKFQYRQDFFGENNDALTDTLQLIDLQSQGIKEAVTNSNTFRFMAQLANFAKVEDQRRFRREFNEANFKAEGNSSDGGLLLFPNTVKDPKQITSNPYTVDAEQMKLIQTNVYNYFGVNEKVLQNSAFGDEWSAFYEGAIEPFAIQFSETMTKAIFTLREQSAGAKVMATANRLQYMTNADKLNVSAQMADRGLMTLNEIREIWNLPPIEGGDRRIIRGEYYDADQKAADEGETDEQNDDGQADGGQAVQDDPDGSAGPEAGEGTGSGQA